MNDQQRLKQALRAGAVTGLQAQMATILLAVNGLENALEYVTQCQRHPAPVFAPPVLYETVFPYAAVLDFEGDPDAYNVRDLLLLRAYAAWERAQPDLAARHADTWGGDVAATPHGYQVWLYAVEAGDMTL